jgi:hypothetical protein
MNVTREEAAKALAEIDKANDRVITLQGYRHGAPFFIVWGLVWLGANTTMQFRPDLGNWAWGIGVTAGAVLSTILGVMMSGKVASGTRTAADAAIGRKIGLTSCIMLVFIFTVVWIANPETNREMNAIISIMFPFIYMAAGVWAGWRLFAIGLVTAAAIIGGYFWIADYYWLWMGVFAGGCLIAGGLWLRKA